MGTDPDPGNEPEQVNVRRSRFIQIGDGNNMHILGYVIKRRTLLIGAAACAVAGAIGGVAEFAQSGRVPARPAASSPSTAGGAIPLSPVPSPQTDPAVLHRTGVLLGTPITGIGAVVDSVAFSPDGRTLAAGCSDWSTRLWDVTDQARPVPLGKPLTGQGDVIYSVAFRPHGHVLATGSGDASVWLWNVTDPGRPVSFGGRENAPAALNTIYSVAFSPDGTTLAIGCETANPGEDPDPVYIWLWNVANPAEPIGLGTLTGHQGPVYTVAFSPDGRTLASGSTDETIRLWDMTDPTRPTSLGQPLAGYPDWVYSAAFSPDGRTLASASAGRLIQLWDVTDRANPAPRNPALAGHSSYVLSVAFSPDGQVLASGSFDTTIRLWNVSSPASPALVTLAGHKDRVNSVAFSPDGRTLASGSSDQTIRLWRIT